MGKICATRGRENTIWQQFPHTRQCGLYRDGGEGPFASSTTTPSEDTSEPNPQDHSGSDTLVESLQA